jgi:hypothetical protein
VQSHQYVPNAWIEPKLGFLIVPLYVHVRRLTTVTGIEEEPIGAVSEDRWHGEIIQAARYAFPLSRFS